MSVSKEGDVWVVRKRIDGKPKKFRASTSGFPNTQKGAKLFEAKLCTELEAGTYRNPDGVIVAEYAEKWFRVHAERQTTPKTQEQYRSIIDQHIKPGLGKRPLARLSPSDIAEFYAGLKRVDGKAGELSSTSKQIIHRTLNAMLNHAVELEVIPRNPIKKGLAPKAGQRRSAFYDMEQSKRILQLAEGDFLYVVLALALDTGMRVGEISALRWTDVDLDAQTITVQRSMEQTSKGTREKGTKTGKGRTIDIGDFLVNVLKQHKGDQAERRLLGSFPEHTGHVITYSNGAPHAPYLLSRKWRYFIKATDLPFLNFHALRHTHISLLIAQGEQAKEIQVRAGHSNISMTMDTYGHLMKGSGAQLAKRLDAAFGR